MEDQFIQSILKVVEDVFTTMVSLNPKAEKHYKSDGKVQNCKISGIMGLAGKINASIVLHFEEQVALKATSNMLGAEYSQIDGDVKDAVGELTNMVAGGVKVDFDNSGMSLKPFSSYCGKWR
jgi:chemotaxis protein CheX